MHLFSLCNGCFSQSKEIFLIGQVYPDVIRANTFTKVCEVECLFLESANTFILVEHQLSYPTHPISVLELLFAASAFTKLGHVFQIVDIFYLSVSFL